MDEWLKPEATLSMGVASAFRLRAKRYGETRRSLGGGGQAEDRVKRSTEPRRGEHSARVPGEVTPWTDEASFNWRSRN